MFLLSSCASGSRKLYFWADNIWQFPLIGNSRNKIKLIIRKAYGFREVKNLIDMVMLVCSNLRIPLEHRKDRDGKKRSGHLKRYFLRATHNYA